MDLQRITYRSVRVPGLTDEALLRTIIAPAYKRNRVEGITGCLWCGEHSFVQVVEGEPEAVHNLMVRIASDPRHRHLTVMSSTIASARVFDAWGLKWVRSKDCVRVEEMAEAVPGSGAAIPPLTVVKEPSLAPEPMITTVHAVRRIIGELVCAEPTYF